MAKDTAIVTMEGEWETVPKLSNSTIFRDLESKPFVVGMSQLLSFLRKSLTVEALRLDYYLHYLQHHLVDLQVYMMCHCTLPTHSLLTICFLL